MNGDDMPTWLREVLDDARQGDADATWPRSDFAAREIARIRRESERELQPVSAPSSSTAAAQSGNSDCVGV